MKDENEEAVEIMRGCLIVVAAMATVTAVAIAVAIHAGAPTGVMAWLVLVALASLAWGALLGSVGQ